MDLLNIKKWSFSNMPESYDSHLSRSIPLYRETQFLITRLGTFFIKDSNYNYEIGCGNGYIIGNLAKKNKNFDNTRFVGIDNSSPLILKAKQKYKNIKNLEFININALKFNFKKSNFVILHYLLQFLNSKDRNKLLVKVFKSLDESGGLIVCEKIYLENAESQEIFSSVYYDFKIKNQYSSEEIINKSISLRSVMKNYSSKEIIKELRDVGFKKIESFFQWGPFRGFLCLK